MCIKKATRSLTIVFMFLSVLATTSLIVPSVHARSALSPQCTNTTSNTAYDSPALAAYGGLLWLAWAGTDGSHHLNLMEKVSCPQ